MHAPDMPPPLEYLRQGASVIPLAPKDKRPYLAILDEHTWAPYQKRRASQAEVQGWLARGHDHNWGVVCGTVSGGLYCGDVDDPSFARWVIEHARDPIMRGATVVESGSGKAHIWFRSATPVISGRWKPRGGKTVGDVRGEGSGGAGPSYMVVPPSIHPDTGEPYLFRVGSLATAPLVDNGEAFLASILQAYLNEHPQQALPPPNGSKHILMLDDLDKVRIWDHVGALKLRARIKDTLLKPGNQSPDSRHWQRLGITHSEIDFQVCCELIRKQQTFEQVEEIFACCHVGDACYRNTSRPNHGQGYLKTTYNNAWAEVERERAASRVAAGTNFKVLNAVRVTYSDDESKYMLTLECTLEDGSTDQRSVEVSDDDLFSQDRFSKALFKRIQFVPKFGPNQQGKHFAGTFSQAVSNSVSAKYAAPETDTRFGVLAMLVRQQLRALPDGEPESMRASRGLGWRVGDTYYLRGLRLGQLCKSNDHNFSPDLTRQVLNRLAPQWDRYQQRWPEGEVEEVIRLLRLRPG